MIVLYLCAQLALQYTYNCCFLIMIYYRLGQNLLIIIKYAVRSRYSFYTIRKGLAYISTLYTITSLGFPDTLKPEKNGRTQSFCFYKGFNLYLLDKSVLRTRTQFRRYTFYIRKPVSPLFRNTGVAIDTVNLVWTFGFIGFLLGSFLTGQ